MICKSYEKRLQDLEDYLDGRLDPALASEVAAHLDLCAACREAVELAPVAGELLRSALTPAGELTGPSWTRLHARLLEIEQQRQNRGEFWASLEALAWRFSLSAAAVLVLMAAYLAGFDSYVSQEKLSVQQTDSREIFPEPVLQPDSKDEVLITLANRTNSGAGR